MACFRAQTSNLRVAECPGAILDGRSSQHLNCGYFSGKRVSQELGRVRGNDLCFIWTSKLELSIYEQILFLVQLRSLRECGALEDLLYHQAGNRSIGLVRVCSCGRRTER